MRCAFLAFVVLVAMRGPAAALAPVDSTASAPESFEFTASLFAYLLPDDDEYLCPILYADRGRLHVEARYNYEDLRTASLWVGRTWGGGEPLTWEVTPMAGIVFGRTDGAAPGVEGALGYRSLEWYVEAEYVIGFAGREDDFFFAWSELSFYPLENGRIGLVAQRTRVRDSEREVDPGLLAGATFGRIACAAYAFNLDHDDRFVALQAEVSW
jgi:hypothetical protein